MVPEYTLAESEKMSLQWDPSRILGQILLALEVDSVVLSRELKLLADMSTRIGESSRKARLSWAQDME